MECNRVDLPVALLPMATLKFGLKEKFFFSNPLKFWI
jgi:hypothetical protein